MHKILFILTIFTLSAAAQTVRSYDITAEFFPEQARMYGVPVSSVSFMQGIARVELAEIIPDTLSFYLHGELTVDSIYQADKKIAFSIDKVMYYFDYARIAVRADIVGAEITTSDPLRIYYSGFFSPSRMRSLSDYMRINSKEGVFLRSYGYSLWFPVFLNTGEESYTADFKKVAVSVPKEFRVLVTGELISEKIGKESMTAVWKPGKMDITEVQCTARPYSVINQEDVFVYHVNNAANAENILRFAIELKQIYGTHLNAAAVSGPLFIMEMPQYGNISSENVVGLTSDVFNNFDTEISSKLTIAHELVHPYVRIPATMENPFYALVVEGFPSFFQIYGMKRTDPSFDLNSHMLEVEEKYLKKRKSDRYPQEKPVLLIKPDEIGTYKDRFILNDRVWLFFYDLWQRMGDERFDAFLKNLFSSDTIDYQKFQAQILTFLPDYESRLNLWLNTTDFNSEMRIQ